MKGLRFKHEGHYLIYNWDDIRKVTVFVNGDHSSITVEFKGTDTIDQHVNVSEITALNAIDQLEK